MKKKTVKVKRARNPVACHPLLMKGAVHVKTHKAKRRSAKQSLIREWAHLILPAVDSSEFIPVAACDANA
jgi:hypothetical protein